MPNKAALLGGLYCLTMAKKKKRETTSEVKIDFLIQKGKEYAKDLVKKATQWELDFKSKA